MLFLFGSVGTVDIMWGWTNHRSHSITVGEACEKSFPGKGKITNQFPWRLNFPNYTWICVRVSTVITYSEHSRHQGLPSQFSRLPSSRETNIEDHMNTTSIKQWTESKQPSGQAWQLKIHEFPTRTSIHQWFPRLFDDQRANIHYWFSLNSSMFNPNCQRILHCHSTIECPSNIN